MYVYIYNVLATLMLELDLNGCCGSSECVISMVDSVSTEGKGGVNMYSMSTQY